MKTKDIESAIFKHWVGKQKKAIIPNVSWGFHIHECDLLVVEKDLSITEVEIKVSKSDLKADQKKWHGHNSSRITRLYFAIPEYLFNDECISFIPSHAGILVIKEVVSIGKRFLVVENKRKPLKNKSNYKATIKDLHTLLYLQTYRLNKYHDNLIKDKQLKLI